MITLLISVAAIGFVAYLIKAFVPMSEPFATIFNAILVAIAIIIVLRLLGIGTLPFRLS